jgi:L-iditol 2-dehydrogenase
MTAAVLTAPGGIAVGKVPVPTVSGSDLLIKVGAASICGTDLRISRHGHFKLSAGTPRILGHELAGTVVDVGSEAGGFAIGDRVSVTPNVGCGHCRFCRLGLNNMCPDYDAFGITLDGGFAEYVRVPGHAVQRGNVFRLPDAVSYTEAALVEPFSCCLRGQDALDITFEDTVLIIGAGPIGAFHVMLARLAGARKILLANRSRGRLDRAGAFGADVLIHTAEQDLREIVLAETSGRGADVVVTCVSDPTVQATAVQLSATHGRVNFFAGLGVARDVGIDTNRVHYQGLTLTGTTGSSNADYARALQLVGDRRVDLSGLVTRTFAVEDIAPAMDYARSGAGMKAAVLFDDEVATAGGAAS